MKAEDFLKSLVRLRRKLEKQITGIVIEAKNGCITVRPQNDYRFSEVFVDAFGGQYVNGLDYSFDTKKVAVEFVGKLGYYELRDISVDDLIKILKFLEMNYGK